MKHYFSKFTWTLALLLCIQIIQGTGTLPALAASPVNTSDLQTEINADNQQIAALNQQIAEYQAELKQAGADKKTLQNAIKALDVEHSEIEAKVAATQTQINSTNLQIQTLGNQITTTEQIIAAYKSGLAESLGEINQSDARPLVSQLFLSGSFSDFWQNVETTLAVQNTFREKSEALQAEENNLAAAQNAVQQKQAALTAQNKSLATEQQSLTATVQSKNELLDETNNKETTYEKLLAKAEAELKSFTSFTQNAGGSSLLANQTVCDSWGCYYNQRDTAWGGEPLNGTGYTLASAGCLVTAMAMVMTHYGYHSVTPATINDNPENFAAYYPAYLLNTITVNGVSATRVSAAIDATLATGAPVIVGIDVDGGTHFVVLVSGGNGNYVMRDPYVASGDNIPFASHYSLKEIYSITKVVVSA